MRNVSDSSCTEDQNTHFVFNGGFPEIILFIKNVGKHGSTREVTDDMTHVICRIPKATDAYSEYVILISFQHEQWLRERASLSRYTYSACLAKNVSTSVGSWPVCVDMFVMNTRNCVL